MIKLEQVNDGYRYNSISIALYKYIISHINFYKKNLNALDLGCGCGVIGILIKQYFDNLNKNNLNIDFLDILELNCQYCQKNLNQNNINARVYNANIADFNPGYKYDLIFSNPPYYKDSKTSSNIHKNISKFISHMPLNILIARSFELLEHRGEMIFCYDIVFLNEILNSLKFYKFNIHSISFIYPKINSKAILAIFSATKGIKRPFEISSPIYLDRLQIDFKG